jgi:MFS family permease
VVVGLGTLMASVDSTATNIALHTIGHAFETSVSDVQWIISAYLLAMATVIPVSATSTYSRSRSLP